MYYGYQFINEIFVHHIYLDTKYKELKLANYKQSLSVTKWPIRFN